ncbi:hypothetical protein SDC9_115796 [bioreactor metagenome]|uniref:Uncharacterized protein n=1 Tax=bioreactor metagenome TaxID=1076179 RepID=A0A645BW67_9ZZZZ
MLAVAAVYDVAKILLGNELVDFERKEVLLLRAVDKAEILRNRVVEDYAANRRIDNLSARFALPFAHQANLDPRLQRDLARLIGHHGLVFRMEGLALAL